ncbi:hypothetical protein EON81_01940 [bacterium]|nr:MAG: hypothetical protein EON81_01940 [bacterium]
MARLTALGLVTKWVVVPAVLAATGYYLIGPKVGGDIVKRARTVLGGVAKAPPKATASKTIAEEITPNGSGNAGASLDGPPPPEVKVTVRPLGEARMSSADPEPKPRRRRRRRKKPATSESTPTPTQSPATTSDAPTADG